jgi:hypothetical protein
MELYQKQMTSPTFESSPTPDFPFTAMLLSDLSFLIQRALQNAVAQVNAHILANISHTQRENGEAHRDEEKRKAHQIASNTL